MDDDDESMIDKQVLRAFVFLVWFLAIRRTSQREKAGLDA